MSGFNSHINLLENEVGWTGAHAIVVAGVSVAARNYTAPFLREAQVPAILPVLLTSAHVNISNNHIHDFGLVTERGAGYWLAIARAAYTRDNLIHGFKPVRADNRSDGHAIARVDVCAAMCAAVRACMRACVCACVRIAFFRVVALVRPRGEQSGEQSIVSGRAGVCSQ